MKMDAWKMTQEQGRMSGCIGLLKESFGLLIFLLWIFVIAKNRCVKSYLMFTCLIRT
jgi:hypothetical protein